jgi:hypothetical protein
MGRPMEQSPNPARALATLLAATLAFTVMAAAASAQPDPLREAQRLRETGDYAAASRLLQAQVAAHPDDGEAMRLLAQTLYWMRDVAAADRTYRLAIDRHPADHRVRLDYARMLLETGDRTRARALLRALRTIPEAEAEADTLLGTLSYWEGDLTAAEQLFSEALRLNPGQPDAGRQLRELQRAAAPWVRITPAFWHDDQPVNRQVAGVEAGWFATPVTPVRLIVNPSRYRAGERSFAMWSSEVDVRHFLPALRLDTEVAAGVLRRNIAGGRSEWTGRGVIGIRVSPEVKLQATVERAPYLRTAASLGTPVSTDVAAGELHWTGRRGWLGHAAFQRQQYPDDNVVRTAYGWILAPVLRRPALDLQAGYAVAADDAAESRFVPVDPARSAGSRIIGINLAGEYAPYYTPARVIRHSATAALTGRISPRATVRASGSHAVHATEDAPTFVASASGPQRIFVRRDFTPWELRTSLDVDTSTNLTIGLMVETGRGSFYEWTNGGVQITYRFTGRSRPAAARH